MNPQHIIFSSQYAFGEGNILLLEGEEIDSD